MTDTAATHPIVALAAGIEISEERAAMLDVMSKRLTVNHSLTLHRDSVSAADVGAMIAYLEQAGMPPTATLRIDGTVGHTRMYATWSEEMQL